MKVELFETYAQEIKRNMIFRVILPDGYDEKEMPGYPVLYLSDGQDLLHDEEAVDGHSWNYWNYYQKYKRFLPEVIIVAVNCPVNNAERTRLYAPYHKEFDVTGKNFEPVIDGQGVSYISWIVNELKPWIDRTYRTRPGKEYTAIGGSSTGALNAMYGIMAFPHIFTRVFSISGAFYIWFDCLELTIEKSDFNDLKYIYLDVGLCDEGRMTNSDKFIIGNKKMYQKFLELGFDNSQIDFQTFDYDQHSHKCFGRRFPDALRWIFQDL